MLNLVFSDGDEIGLVEENVRRLQHRIVQQAGKNALFLGRLFLKLRLPLQLAEWRDGVEYPRELGMFRRCLVSATGG